MDADNDNSVWHTDIELGEIMKKEEKLEKHEKGESKAFEKKEHRAGLEKPDAHEEYMKKCAKDVDKHIRGK